MRRCTRAGKSAYLPDEHVGQEDFFEQLHVPPLPDPRC
jgi:hypothetical protein